MVVRIVIPFIAVLSVFFTNNVIGQVQLLKNYSFEDDNSVFDSRGGMTLRLSHGVECKTLFLEGFKNKDNPTQIYYCSNYCPIPDGALNARSDFQDELKYFEQLLDSAKNIVHLNLKRCTISFRFNDLLDSVGRILANSNEWRTNANVKSKSYNEKLASKIVFKSNIISQLEKVLKKYHYKIVGLKFYINKDDQNGGYLSRASLKTIRLDENLILPCITTLELKLVKY